MTDEPQVALTAPPITHVWATTYESAPVAAQW